MSFADMTVRGFLDGSRPEARLQVVGALRRSRAQWAWAWQPWSPA